MKATKDEVRRRTDEILQIRLDGAQFWHIRSYVREKEAEAGSAWELKDGAKPMSDSQIGRYVKVTEKLMAESCRVKRRRLIYRHMAKCYNLFAKAVSAGDLRTALSIIKEVGELKGLYPPPRAPAEVSRLQLQLEEMEAEIAKLRAGYETGQQTTVPPPPKAPHPGTSEGCQGTAQDPGQSQDQPAGPEPLP